MGADEAERTPPGRNPADLPPGLRKNRASDTFLPPGLQKKQGSP